MAARGLAFEQQVHRGATLRAVAGARQRDHQARALRRQALAAVGQDLAAADGRHGNAQRALECEGQAFAGVERTAGAGERHGADAAERLRQCVAMANGGGGGGQPREWLLGDFAQGMIIARLALPLFGRVQQGGERRGAAGQIAEVRVKHN